MDKKVYEFISQIHKDPIIHRKTCAWTGEDFPIFQGDIDLLKKISPTIGGVQYDLPLPTLSPKARQIRRLMRRNDRKIYKTTCKITGKPLVTCYHPDVETNIVDHMERYKSVDNTKYGRDFDFSRPFNQQLSDLISQTVKKNILTVGFIQNSEYTHNSGDMKNCYMVFDTGMCEDCLYGVRITGTKNVLDGYEVHKSENVYDGITIHKCRNIFYSQNCESCTYSAFLYNCVGCNNCICCTNQVNKNYYILNKPVSKEEYQNVRNELFDGTVSSYQKFQSLYEGLLKQSFRKNMNMTNCQESIGQNLSNCKDVVLCEEMTDVQNMRYCDRVNGYSSASDVMDVSSRGRNMSRCYELNCCGSDRETSAYNCHFSSYLFRGVNNAQYSLHIPSMCDYIFGCSDIDKKSFCILNKEYSREEYEKIVPQIIAHMQTTGERGEFLDPTCSPFPYNDTIACDYYPIHSLHYPDGTTKIINPQGRGVMTIHEPEKTISPATLDLGGKGKITTTRKTRELEVNVPDNLKQVQAKELPESIYDATDDITTYAIICEQSGRPFRIVQQELDFYRKHGIPLPRLHPDIRHLARLAKVTPFDLSLRSCDKCGIEMLSVYKKESEFQVYCEACYNKEIYG